MAPGPISERPKSSNVRARSRRDTRQSRPVGIPVTRAQLSSSYVKIVARGVDIRNEQDSYWDRRERIQVLKDQTAET